MSDVLPEIIDALGGRMPTPQQWEAISAPLESCVLIAGAGSGKTAVMAARIVFLVSQGHAKAGEILGLTFTNKAADSLLTRVRAALAPLGLPAGEEPTIATYHGFAARLIADYGLRAGVEPGAVLLSESQAWQLCADLYQRQTYNAMEVRSTWHVGWIRGLADDCANHLVDPASVIEHDEEFLKKIAESGGKIAARVKKAARQRVEMAEVVRMYQEAKGARQVVDYGDQIRIASEIARDPRVVADFQLRYRFALLDEYQDTNIAQAKMLKSLMPDGYPVMAVGDPDQNIYAWRGASLHNLQAFDEQFPRAQGLLAERRKLTVNFRSGARILHLANILIESIPAERRPAEKVLEAHPPLGEGSVAVLLATDEVAEAEAIADEATRANAEGTPWREIAILCRKKRLFSTLASVFRARAIPLEVIGLGGLLKMPEIVDLVALLRVLNDPLRNVALARLLRGPRWRIGHRDLALIAKYASGMNHELRVSLPGDADEGPGDVAFSLAEALGSLGEIDGLSAEARGRLKHFVVELADLRAHIHLPLPDLVARALDALGIMRELDASVSNVAPAARRNIANFLDRVAAFKPIDGEAHLVALMDWLDAIQESDEEIEAAQPTDEDSVKVMTIHQAKGLEFDLVFVPGLARGPRSQIFPDTTRQANPATGWRFLPFELRGDAAVLPRFTGNLSAFTDALKQRAGEEERRLLYVAVTRARKRLVCSAAHWYYPSGMGEALKIPMGPSEYWAEIRAFAGVEVLGEADAPEINPLIERRAHRASVWPAPARRAPDPLFAGGLADVVEQARAMTTPDETLFAFDEPPTSGARPRALPVSSIVTYERCPKQFYWSYVRPLPRRGSSAARRGTLFHSWIEERERAKAQFTLYDPEDFTQRATTDEAHRVQSLRDAFRQSRFAKLQTDRIERPFSLVVDGTVIQGRIDAIYEDGDRWEIVDWKSGIARDTEGPERWQLDLYALAAQEIWGKRPEDITVTFAYFGGETVTEQSYPARPAADLRADLAVRLEAIAREEFAPSPGQWCKGCDFQRVCAEGSAFRG